MHALESIRRDSCVLGEKPGGMMIRIVRTIFAAALFCLLIVATSPAQDVPNSFDPPGMKRYEGSEIIGYRGPKFDEYLVPLGPPTSQDPPAYKKSVPLEGQVSYYTYLAPEGRTPTELFRNYKLEFQRLSLETLYEKDAGQPGWFGPTTTKIAKESDIGQIIVANQDEERMLVGKTKDAQPTYYVVFVTAYRAGIVPDRLGTRVNKGRALAQIVVVTPDTLEKKMTFVNADDMKQALHDSGKVALFDTDKDVVKPE